MKDSGKQSLEQIQTFLEGSPEIRFKGKRLSEVYAWITQTLRVPELSEAG